jgi:N-dimethylarginine dimethylaminohydrolase
MTPPEYFRVEDLGINPYMTGEIPINPERAKRQWFALYNLLVDMGVTVYLAKPLPNLPDMVFSANAGTFIGNTFLPSQFLYPSRQGETEVYTETLKKLGYRIYQTYPEMSPFEGQGDTQLVEDRAWIGYGFRTSKRAAHNIGGLLKKRGKLIHYLHLVDPYFYHLDTWRRVICDKKADWFLY